MIRYLIESVWYILLVKLVIINFLQRFNTIYFQSDKYFNNNNKKVYFYYLKINKLIKLIIFFIDSCNIVYRVYGLNISMTIEKRSRIAYLTKPTLDPEVSDALLSRTNMEETIVKISAHRILHVVTLVSHICLSETKRIFFRTLSPRTRNRVF